MLAPCKISTRNPDWFEACEELERLPVDPQFYAMRRTADRVCRRRGLKLSVAMSRSKDPALIECRREIFWRCRHDLGKTYTEIGRAFGRDQSTVRFAVVGYQGAT